MSPSKINPNVWDGEERSGGFIAKNERPTSANSPHYKGRLYLKGVGWFWLSGWTKRTGSGELLSLRVQDMTDEQAAKYCAPKQTKPGANKSPPNYQPPLKNESDSPESDIPF